jgi:hypothetical protein
VAVPWVVRGDISAAEAAITKPTLGALGSPAPYTDDQVVRDVALPLPEAIHVCSYLRNFMTAHRFTEALESVGPYEVFNVQSVARRILLSKCGIWDVCTDDLLPLPRNQERPDERGG